MSKSNSSGGLDPQASATGDTPRENPRISSPESVRGAREWGGDELRKKDIRHPVLTADLLLAHALGVPRLELALRDNESISDDIWTSFRSMIRERINHRPLEYITKEATFFGYSFHMDERALIPRPETESLVDYALSRLPETGGKQQPQRPRRVCDLGVGSGVILHTLCLECPDLEGVGVDVSSDAIALARENAHKHGIREQVELLEGNFLESGTVKRLRKRGPFDAVVSNPPYVRSDEMDQLPPKVRNFEPEVALEAPEERTTFFRSIIKLADQITVDGGCFAMEMAERDHPEPVDVREYTSFSRVTIEPDHRGQDRFLLAD